MRRRGLRRASAFALPQRLWRGDVLRCVDLHCGGEPATVVLGKDVPGATMEATNPGGAPRNEEFLRKKYGGSVQHQMHAKAQRASLQALLDDARSKGNPGRYSKALEGEVQGSLSDGARKFSRS